MSRSCDSTPPKGFAGRFSGVGGFKRFLARLNRVETHRSELERDGLLLFQQLSQADNVWCFIDHFKSKIVASRVEVADDF
jgi:hypothetical protein